ncbi:MAG: (d)CMP kinase [Defluviitaleaceae bacterium]|nr:(d)CMP kinase [Defluviitaleaceae bacterium]
MQIAIDGPSGSGKSTIAKMLSQKAGIVYMDTGALYRASGLFAIRMGTNLEDEAAIKGIIDKMRLEIKYIDGEQRTFLNGEDVTNAVRADEVGLAASAVGRFEFVRERVVSFIRDTASKQSVVMDGRDIGTVVLPNADVKIFLTASVDIRTRRRCVELAALLGHDVDYDTIFAQIEQRDYQDMNRKIAPLKKADDAVEIDAAHLTKEEVVDKILEIDAVTHFLKNEGDDE